MISNLLWMLKYIREELLEKFMIPELNISYWDFCIYLAMAAIVITVLVNSVKVSGSVASNAKSERMRHRNIKEYSGSKSAEKDSFNSSIDAWQSRVESEDS